MVQTTFKLDYLLINMITSEFANIKSFQKRFR